MIDIEDWVKDNLERPRKSSGHEWTAMCPSCGAEPGRFYVNVESGSWICFKEEEFRGKKIWGLIAKVEGITASQARAEALRANVKFARRRKGPLASLKSQVTSLRTEVSWTEDESPRVAAEMPRETVAIFDPGRAKQWKYPRYLKQRGIKKNTCKQFSLGYVPPGVWWDGGGRPQNIGSRVIVPIVSPTGYSWSARDMTGEQEPKYLNPLGADHRKLLHGWDQISLESDIVIVEGPFDVINMHQLGIPALGILGKELNREQMGLLCRKPVDASITVMLDPEEAIAPYKVATMLKMRFNHVYVARLPDGCDPGDASKRDAWDAWDSAERYNGSRTAAIASKLTKLSQR